MPTGNRRRRRGSIYVMVLGAVVSVMVIGLSAVTALRIERRSVGLITDFSQARFYAQSAIEMGFCWISDDANWRTNRPHGVWVADQPIGDGSFTLEVVDPNDGNLADDPNHAFVLTGTGTCGDTRFLLQVMVVPDSGGYEVSPGTWRQVVIDNENEN